MAPKSEYTKTDLKIELMAISVKFFALGKELAGTAEITVEMPDGETLGKLVEDLRATYPNLDRLNSFMTAVNMEYCDPETVLKNGDEVAIIPPVSGG